jgi:hypothetical protein
VKIALPQCLLNESSFAFLGLLRLAFLLPFAIFGRLFVLAVIAVGDVSTSFIRIPPLRISIFVTFLVTVILILQPKTVYSSR